MINLILKFSKAGEVMLDTRAETFATRKTCMLAPKHWRFVGCESDKACFEASISSATEVFEIKALNEEPGIFKTERVQAVAKIYLEAAKAIKLKQRILCWDAPPCLLVTQAFPLNTFHFLSNKFKDSTSFQSGR